MSTHPAAVSHSLRTFVPGMGVDWLLPLYDPVTRLLGLNHTRRTLLEQSDLRPGHRVLDIGCGTGSLAVLIKRSFPDVAVVGLDPDAKALDRATRKARRAGVNISFHRGFSDALPYPDASFDRVFSSFMFHHLGRDEKEHTLHEVRRVLTPDGTLQLLDFAGQGPAGSSRTRGLHAHHRFADNDEATMRGLFERAGLDDMTKTTDRVVLGSIRVDHYRARRGLK